MKYDEFDVKLGKWLELIGMLLIRPKASKTA